MVSWWKGVAAGILGDLFAGFIANTHSKSGSSCTNFLYSMLGKFAESFQLFLTCNYAPCYLLN